MSIVIHRLWASISARFRDSSLAILNYPQGCPQYLHNTKSFMHKLSTGLRFLGGEEGFRSLDRIHIFWRMGRVLVPEHLRIRRTTPQHCTEIPAA